MSQQVSPLYDLYPKDPKENLRWRIRCRERALEDLNFRQALYDACMLDPLFWMAFAMWSFEPRAKVKVRPFCLAGDTLVVTDHGLVPIKSVELHYRVWDGTMWVTHDGCAYRGERETISAYGIELTPDHQVLTTEGWRDASIAGLNRQEVRLPDGYREKWIEGAEHNMAVSMPVRCGEGDSRVLAEKGADQELRVLPIGKDDKAWNVSDEYVYSLGKHDATVHESTFHKIPPSWWAWGIGLRAVEKVHKFLRRYGRETGRTHAGSNRQRRRLRAGKLSLGDQGGASQQYSGKPETCDILWDALGGSNSENRRGNAAVDSMPREGWLQQGRLASSSQARPEAVYDLVNCGPRQAFTVVDDSGQPLLVHNCPWPHQESVFMALDQTVDECEETEQAIDVLVDKSRAQGGTFGYLWLDLRRWLRDRMFSAGYVTRNESLVDSKTDSDTLFWKLDWAINKLPFWMVPEGFDWRVHRSYSNHSLLNPANGASLVGYAAGQDVGMGGRKTVFTCDEFGAKDFIAGAKDEAVMDSLHDVTNHLRLVSARYADAGVFHNACEDPDSARAGRHLILDWKDNPIHGKNSYIVRGGRAEARNPNEQAAVDAYHAENPDLRGRLERKGFKFEGVVRSPWYDMRCLRPTSTPRLIASQLDRDPRGAVGKVFPTELLDKVKKEKCKPPIWRGTPVFDSETLELNGLVTRPDGPLKLWFRPGPDFSCPFGPFTVGCDIAIGSDGAYSSNSVASGIDHRNGEQMMEYTIKGMPMIKFARIVVGLCKWLRYAKLGWEDSGMVGPFAKEIMEVLYYNNVYYREVPEIGTKRKTRKAGWWNGKDEHKADLFEKMTLAMETNQYIIRSEDLIRECGEYEWDNGKIIHQPTKNRGAQERAHGDRCIGAGVAYLVYSEDGASIDIDEEAERTPEYGSFLWCEQQEQPRHDPGSPEFGILDVIM